MRKKLLQLKQEQAEQFGSTAPARMGEAGSSGSHVRQVEASKNKPEEFGTLIDKEDLLQQAYEDYDAGAYSPKILKPADIPEEIQMVAEEEDCVQRALARSRVTSGSKDIHDFSHLKMSPSIGGDRIAEEEYTYNSEVALEAQNYIWQGKYRPRKPRFFNCVCTGFEWNKYNQTHYDMNSPPPKTVLGYRFQIFYPELIDDKRTPSWQILPCKDNFEICILKFEAGPPHEDIAFKIVKRPYRIVRNQLQKSTLQLWFRYKPYRYRR